jgi:hypothetical protein
MMLPTGRGVCVAGPHSCCATGTTTSRIGALRTTKQVPLERKDTLSGQPTSDHSRWWVAVRLAGELIAHVERRDV